MILTDFNVCLSELLFLSGFRSLYLGIDVFAGKGHFGLILIVLTQFLGRGKMQ